MIKLNEIYCGDCVAIMKGIDDCFIDLTVTSPPYDSLRKYRGYNFGFNNIADELFRITKEGGVVVWVVADESVKGSETGTSFRQALYFKDIGFKLHDTMIYQRHTIFPRNNRYRQEFEYMFVFVKGKLKTFHPYVKVLKAGKNKAHSLAERQKDGTFKKLGKKEEDRFLEANKNPYRLAGNVWYIPAGFNHSTKDRIAYKHPAIFPEKLAENHILSWSDEGDIVLDPMAGSGTTCKIAKIHNRQYIGIDCSKEYCEIAKQRIKDTFLLN